MENQINDPARNPRGNEAEYTRSLAEYESLKGGVALIDRSPRSILKLTGKGSIEMLNAILTNEVPKRSNVGTYAALLNPKGRIQTDLRVLKAVDDVLVVVWRIDEVPPVEENSSS